MLNVSKEGLIVNEQKSSGDEKRPVDGRNVMIAIVLVHSSSKKGKEICIIFLL